MENLQDKQVWCCWKGDKKPRNPETGALCKSNDPSSWSTYQDCFDAVASGDFDGYGCMCVDDYVFIDIDSCLEELPNGDVVFTATPDGNIPASEVVHRFKDTYTEVSKSHTGIHIIARGRLDIDKTGIRARGVEIYKAARFLIITDNVVSDSDEITYQQEALEWCCELVQSALSSEKTNKGTSAYGKCPDRERALKQAMKDEVFRNYYCGVRPFDDESRNDHGFITKLCFYFSRDPEACYDVLLASPYHTTKDAKHKEKMERRFDSYFLPTFEQVNATIDRVWLEDEPEEGTPEWVVEGKQGIIIDEVIFVRDFMSDLHYINGLFYDNDSNQISEGKLKQDIQETVGKYKKTNLAATVNNLLTCIKNKYYEEAPPITPDVIHTANFDLHITKDTVQPTERTFSIYKMPVNYQPTAECPRWERFIEELFYPEDVPVIQEYLGYLLVPTTVAQTALFILGQGGEGKSRITHIVSRLFGSTAQPVDIVDISNDRFFGAQAENAMVIVDDDAQINKIEDTSLFKKLVTADSPMVIEQKYMPKRTAMLYARILVCSNEIFNSKFDRSDGFYRRLLQVRVKPVDKDRKNDVMLSKKLANELEGILNWCIKGLQRLMAQDYVFTHSCRIAEIGEEAKREGNSVIPFLEDAAWVEFDPAGVAANVDIYDQYCKWCDDAGYFKMSRKTVVAYLMSQMEQLNLKYSKHIKRNNTTVRGFIGMRLVNIGDYSPHIALME